MTLLLFHVASSTHALTRLPFQIHRQVQRAPPARKRGREPHHSLVGQCPRQRRVSRLPCVLLPIKPFRLSSDPPQLPASGAERLRESSPGAQDRCGLLRQRFLLHALPEVLPGCVRLRASGCMMLRVAGTATTTSAGASCSPRTSALHFSCPSSPAAAPSPSRSTPVTPCP